MLFFVQFFYYFINHIHYLIGGDHRSTFVTPVSACQAGTVPEISKIEILELILAAVAGVIVDHPVGGLVFIEGIRKAGNHDHRNLTSPRQPA